MFKKLSVIVYFLMASSLLSSAQYVNTKIQVGQDAPELTFANPDGDTLSLKEISKGRYVLIDFWASWCGPCRRANPAVVAMYQKYSQLKYKNANNGFTIFSVSLDRDKDAWVKAIKNDNLSWPYHVSDLKSWKSEAANIYGLAFIPQAMLIGPDGKVIAKYTETIDKNIAQMAMEDLDKYVVSSQSAPAKKKKK